MPPPATVVDIDAVSGRLRDSFLRWQCRLRQIAVREAEGRPSAGLVPELTPVGSDQPLGSVVTVLSRLPEHSVTMEFRHLVRRTNDPNERRQAALKYLGESYFQRHTEFSDVLTATFPPDSPGAVALTRAQRCGLRFEQFSQRYDLTCRVWRLSRNNPLREATFWHNLLFNPGLDSGCVILGFEPHWSACRADPPPPRG